MQDPECCAKVLQDKEPGTESFFCYSIDLDPRTTFMKDCSEAAECASRYSQKGWDRGEICDLKEVKTIFEDLSKHNFVHAFLPTTECYACTHVWVRMAKTALGVLELTLATGKHECRSAMQEGENPHPTLATAWVKAFISLME